MNDDDDIPAPIRELIDIVGGTGNDEDANPVDPFYDAHWKSYDVDDDDPEDPGEAVRVTFGQNSLKQNDGRNYYEERSPLHDQIGADGEYKVTLLYACQGKACGLRCHPKKAMAYTIRHLDIDDEKKEVKLCGVCEIEYFQHFETFDNVGSIMKKKLDLPFPLGHGKEAWISVCDGDASLLYELWDSGDFAMTFHELGYTPDELKSQTNSMIREHIFCDYFNRGLLTSGLASRITEGIMQVQPAFNDMIQFMGGTDNIAHSWCQLALTGAYQDNHADNFIRPTSPFRHIWNLFVHPSGEVRKLMTIANRKTGRWVSFLVPHSSVVSISALASGNDAKHMQHRIDFSDWVFCYITETNT